MSKLSEMPVLTGRENDGPLITSGSLEKSKMDSIPGTPSEESRPEIHDYPDGGLRAWMVVCGVCGFLFQGELESGRLMYPSDVELDDVYHIFNVRTRWQLLHRIFFA